MTHSGPTCPEPVHDHDRRCYWDHLRCGWVCPPARPDPEPEQPYVPQLGNRRRAAAERVRAVMV